MYLFAALEKLLAPPPAPKKEVPIAPAYENGRSPTNKKQEFKGNSKPAFKNNFSSSNNKSFSNNKPKFKDKESFSSPEKKEKPQNCYGIFVKDGDSFVAMYNNERVEFRLAGIDTPEKEDPFYEEAKKFLYSKIKSKVIYLEFKGTDPYKREIVEAYEDKEKNISINSQLLSMGLATSERYKNNKGEKTHNIIEHLGNELTELSANITQKGIWSEEVKNPNKRKFPP